MQINYMNTEVPTFLIVYNDGTEKTIDGVLNYGYTGADGVFYYERTLGYKNFISPHNVRYFGRQCDYVDKRRP